MVGIDLDVGMEFEGGDVAFAYALASQGADWHSPLHKPNVNAARAAGVPVGSLHVLTLDSGVDQAISFYTAIAEASAFVDTLPPAVEITRTENLGAGHLKWFCESFLNLWEIPLLIRTSYEFWRDMQGDRGWFSQFPLWVKDWQRDPPLVPGPWEDWALWQMGPGENVARPSWRPSSGF